MKTALTAMFFLTMSAAHLSAETNVKAYKEKMATPNGKIVATAYIQGLGDGIAWANTIATKNNAPLYCQPEGLAINVENYIDILDRHIQAALKSLPAAKVDELWIGLQLLDGLRETFPCSKGAK